MVIMGVGSRRVGPGSPGGDSVDEGSSECMVGFLSFCLMLLVGMSLSFFLYWLCLYQDGFLDSLV